MTSPSPAPRRRSLLLRGPGFLLFVLCFLRALVLANLQLAGTILFGVLRLYAP